MNADPLDGESTEGKVATQGSDWEVRTKFVRLGKPVRVGESTAGACAGQEGGTKGGCFMW